MFQRVLSPFRDFGLFDGSIYAANRVLARLSPRLGVLYHYWMVQPISDKPLLPERLARSYETRVIPEGDPLIEAMPLREGVAADRFRQDAVCMGTFRRGQLVAYIWLSFGTYEEDEARCTFLLQPESESVFDFDVFVMEESRLGLAFVAAWDGVSRYLRERGIRYSFSRLDRFNEASAKAHDHFGWKRVGSAVILRLWDAEIIFASIPPRVSVLLNPKRRAQVVLTPAVLARND